MEVPKEILKAGGVVPTEKFVAKKSKKVKVKA